MPITISIATGTTPAGSARGPGVLVVPVATMKDIAALGLAARLRAEIERRVRQRDFAAEWGEAIFLVVPQFRSTPFVAIVGLGRDSDFTAQAEGLRRGIGRVIRDAKQHGLTDVSLVLNRQDTAAILAGAAVEAAELANYSFSELSDRLKKKSAKQNVRRLTLMVPSAVQRDVRRAVARARQVTAGVALARDLVNRPADRMSPAALVAVAQEIEKSSPRLKLATLNRREAAARGFSAFLAVARGSSEEPYVIHLTYTPRVRTARKLFLVGKGVTFDSGGLSLKPADYMEDMKSDMAGAASVLGAFAVLAHLEPNVEVHGLIAACENMPSGTAYRPGDVVRAKNGKTIEVLNTDAEGRVTLADTLSYAVELNADAIIDLATLTGACMVALGETVAGLWSTDEDLRQLVEAAAKQAGEGVQSLPMPAEYKAQIESRLADVRNTSTSRFGGAITAAMFLREFVGETPWLHLDIAGPSYATKQHVSYLNPGATGFGVRTLVGAIESFTDTPLGKR